MVKRLSMVLVLLLVVLVIAGAQDRIAVMDTVLPKGIDTGVVIPVTEKIMEEFVRSKLFIVLDRSFIAKTLSEQEFSTSDLTSGDSAKLATIGGFLKASYIVVSTVQKLDTRFFLSAKMIEVKSGVIMAQTSVDRDGTISVLIDMAGELGRKLVAASMGQEAPKPSGRASTQPAQSAPPAQTAPPARVARQPREPRPSGDRFSTASVDFGTGIFEELSGISYGASAFVPFGLWYISAGASMIDANSGQYYQPLVNPFYFTDYYSDLDIFLGIGVDAMLGPVLFYGGARVSYTSITLSVMDYYDDLLFDEVFNGVGYGLEFGADVRFGSFAVGVRYSALSGDVTSDYDGSTSTFKNSTLMLRASYAF
jgi:TolB-like protein